ncbi:hypothetical protein PM3016_1734 [Paenibacillus mucilaginosus 3016]|uniref:Uncharacterized protein n=2 Tax=Paenibacillus mucilaginosus TaxID=61624 RepID=H6NEV5_9BACL|nr:hypothetical protein [Paenibacillus mucilaginosus]AFC28646.1 hypothetical protein PM3016_1734 [Paenibacillus mucilaginosus 3016]AFH60820.1 hypothetical protein B2K_08830 [Paenibacillus mucilaginosus K02]WFA17426.1 hypothetical protein ERY13_09115 [Paenibacillus mucilaginosus]
MREREREDGPLDPEELKQVLTEALEQENELLRTYVIASERIEDNEELRVRLQNFAEGNAKRSRQLIEELGAMKDADE